MTTGHAPSPASWRSRLAFAVAAHDVIVATDRLIGGVSPHYEPARLAVVDAIDAALAAGVAEATIDATIAELRAQAAAAPATPSATAS